MIPYLYYENFDIKLFNKEDLCHFYLDHIDRYDNISLLEKYIQQLPDGKEKNEIILSFYPILVNKNKDACIALIKTVNMNLLYDNLCTLLDTDVLFLEYVGLKKMNEGELILIFDENKLVINPLLFKHFDCFLCEDLVGEKECLYNYEHMKNIIVHFFTGKFDGNLEIIFEMNKLGYHCEFCNLKSIVLDKIDTTFLSELKNKYNINDFISKLIILCEMEYDKNYLAHYLKTINTDLFIRTDLMNHLYMYFRDELIQYECISYYPKIINYNNYQLIFEKIKEDNPFEMLKDFFVKNPCAVNHVDITKYHEFFLDSWWFDQLSFDNKIYVAIENKQYHLLKHTGSKYEVLQIVKKLNYSNYLYMESHQGYIYDHCFKPESFYTVSFDPYEIVYYKYIGYVNEVKTCINVKLNYNKKLKLNQNLLIVNPKASKIKNLRMINKLIFHYEIKEFTCRAADTIINVYTDNLNADVNDYVYVQKQLT